MPPYRTVVVLTVGSSDIVAVAAWQASPEHSKPEADPVSAAQPKPARAIAAESDRPVTNVRRPPPMAFGSRVNDERMPTGTASKRPRSVQVRCQDHRLHNTGSISS